MGTRVVTEVFDDLDDSLMAEETIVYAIDGVTYTIDLSAENASKFRGQLREWIERSRLKSDESTNHDDDTKPPKRDQLTPEHEPTRPLEGNSSPANTADVRAWAKANGVEVSDRGKIAKHVVEQYRLSIVS